MRLRSIGFALVVLLVSSVAVAAPPNAFRLDPSVSPTFEAVHLNVDPAKSDYSGTVRIEISVNEPASEFFVNAEDLKITTLALSGDRGEIPVSFEPRSHGRVAVIAPAPLAAGEYTLTIAFTNAFSRRAVGLYRMEKGGRSYAFTQFQAADGRRAFPMWDEPQYKIPWQVTLTVPLELEALSNTPGETIREADGLKTIVFAKTRPLPSYLVAVAVGPFDYLPVAGMRIPTRIVAPRGEAQLGATAASMTPRILEALERYFASKYPYEKLDLIAVPEFWYGAMEHPGAVTYRDSILLLDPATVTPGQKRKLARITAHELAHMWFGNLVTMSWWDELWLNESFADWMGDKITDELYPQYKLGLVEMESVKQIMDFDARPSASAVRTKVTHPGDGLGDVGLAYSKGKAVLGMFEQWIGSPKFREGVVAYVNAHADRNATAADFFAAIGKAAKVDAGAAMATFLDQPGFPRIDAELLPNGDVKLSQQRFSAAGAAATPQSWRVPVAIRYADAKGTRTATFLLDRPSAVFPLRARKPAWIFPDAHGVGYYRWTLPAPALQKLSREAESLLTPRERIALLNNASSLLTAGELPGDTYLELLASFAADPEPQVVATVLNAYGQISLAFATDDVRPQWAGHLRRTLRPVLDRYGMAPKAGEDDVVTIVRPILVAILGSEGEDPAIREWAKTSAAAWLRDPSALHSTLVNPALEITAEHGDAALWEEFRKRFEAATAPNERNRYLALLGRFADPELSARALAYVFEGPLRPTEVFAIPFSSATTAGGRERVFRWMTANFDAIAKVIPPPFLAYMPQVASGCEAERLDAAAKFFADPKHRVDGTERTLAQVSDQVSECVRMRAREAARVGRFLRGGDGPQP